MSRSGQTRFITDTKAQNWPEKKSQAIISSLHGFRFRCFKCFHACTSLFQHLLNQHSYTTGMTVCCLVSCKNNVSIYMVAFQPVIALISLIITVLQMWWTWKHKCTEDSLSFSVVPYFSVCRDILLKRPDCVLHRPLVSIWLSISSNCCLSW